VTMTRLGGLRGRFVLGSLDLGIFFGHSREELERLGSEDEDWIWDFEVWREERVREYVGRNFVCESGWRGIL
jgi:hypothetical protein